MRSCRGLESNARLDLINEASCGRNPIGNEASHAGPYERSLSPGRGDLHDTDLGASAARATESDAMVDNAAERFMNRRSTVQ